jgi:hypothetical protein
MQCVGIQAKHVRTPGQMRSFVAQFCVDLRSRPEYKHALLAITIESNNNAMSAIDIAHAFSFYTPCYFFATRDLDTHQPEDIVMSLSQMAKTSMLAENAGVLIGHGILTKEWFTARAIAAFENERVCRAEKLCGLDAEVAWSDFLKELLGFRAYVERSEKKPHIVRDKLALSGKKSGTGHDDLVMAFMEGVTVCSVTLCNRKSALRWFCDSRSLHFETE